MFVLTKVPLIVEPKTLIIILRKERVILRELFNSNRNKPYAVTNLSD